MNSDPKTAAHNAADAAHQASDMGHRVAAFQKNQILSSYQNQREDILKSAYMQQANLIQSHVPSHTIPGMPASETSTTTSMPSNSASTRSQGDFMQPPKTIPTNALAQNPLAQQLQRPGPPSQEMQMAAQVVEALREFVAEEVGRQIKALAAAVNIEVPSKK